ncbi:OmpA family protein [Streptomonospora litoralis]|uniref:Outer membrane porin F n=1 Tax=Streptomonospora litoralis TaxID=2498135 RepID=A0A4P6Q6C5_9ACTN|nr:OmpA family protein [Streptomonospora litoralis]QBI55870.1 Outer membrane porin F precursor [Streptomonospora litoralis]
MRGRGEAVLVLAAVLAVGPALVGATGAPGAADVGASGRAASISGLDAEGSVSALDLEAAVQPLQKEDVEGTTTTVTVAADVLFEFDEAEPTDVASGELADIADRLRGVSGPVQVIGHTDGPGDDAYNQRLSERRAEAVRDVLTRELGADAPEFEVSGRGSEDPVADETDDEGNDLPLGRAQNRRVEIVFDGT